MGRCLAAAVMLLVLCPLPAAPQGVTRASEEAFGPGHLSVTPFVGWRYRYAAIADQAVEVGGEVFYLSERIEVEGAPVIGAELSFPLSGRFAAVGSFAYGFAGSVETISLSSSGSSVGFSPEGGTFMFAKVGGSYQFIDRNPEFRLRELAATASVAPGIVRIDPPGNTALLSDDAITHLGVAVAADAYIPLAPWPRLALNVSLEDFITFWNAGEMSARAARDIGTEIGQTVRVEVDADPTNIILLQAGVTYRF